MNEQESVEENVVAEECTGNDKNVTHEIPDEPWSEEVELANHREYALF